MAEANTESTQAVESTVTKNKLPLEQMSKEDLMKQIKRQLVLLQKAKSKSDEMTKRCAELEKERDELRNTCEKDDNGNGNDNGNGGDNAVLLRKKVTDLESKLEKLKHEKKEEGITLQDAHQEQFQENLLRLQEERDAFYTQCLTTREEMECMKMKIDTLTISCHCFQEEIKKLQDEKKALLGKSEVLSEEREDVLKQLQSLNDKLNSTQHAFVESEGLKQERDTLKRTHQELENKMTLMLEENIVLAARIDVLTQENKHLVQEREQMSNQWEQVLKEHESWKLHVETCKSEKNELYLQKQECSNLKEHIEQLESSLNQASKENKNLVENVKDRTSQVNNLQTKISVLSVELDALKKQNEELQKNLEILITDKNKWQCMINEMESGGCETVVRLNEEVIKTSSLEMELSVVIQEKQDILEKLYQLEELQQFVEDETRGLREENDKLKFEIKRLEEDLENDILHVRKLENELQEAEEREHISYMELNKMKKKFHELEKADHILKSKIKSEETSDADIQMMMTKCKDLELEKEMLLQQLESFKQNKEYAHNLQGAILDKNINLVAQSTDIGNRTQVECIVDRNLCMVKNCEESHHLSSKLVLDNGDNVDLLQSNCTIQNTVVDEALVSDDSEDTFVNELHILKGQLKVMSERETELKRSLEDKSDLVEKIHCQMDELLLQIEELTAELEEKKSDLQTAGKILQEQQDKINNLKTCGIEKDENLANLELKLTELKKENCSLKSDLEILLRTDESQDGQNKADEILKLSNDKTELESKIVDLNRCIQENVEKIDNVMADNEKLRLAEQAATEKVSRIRKQITAELEEQLNVKSMASERTEKEMVRDIQNLTLYLQEKKMQVSALGSENNLLTSEVNMLQMSIKSIEEYFTSQICQLQKELNQKANMSSSLEHQNKLLQEHLEKLTSDLAEYESSNLKITMLQGELEDAHKISDKMQLENIQHKEELSTFKDILIPKTEDELNSLKQQLQEKVVMTQNLEEEKNQLLKKICTFEKNELFQQRVEDKVCVENLQQALKDSETKMAKFKTLALKVKKELAETNKKILRMNEEKDELAKELDAATSSSYQHLQNFKSLQNEYDKLQDEYESVKLAAKHLEQDLSSSSSELLTVKEQLENIKVERDHLKHLIELTDAEKKNTEQTRKDLEDSVAYLQIKQESEKQKTEEMKMELQKSEKKIKIIEEQLKEVQEKYKATTQQLEQALKEGKKQTLIDLEMADYERTISELNNQLCDKNGVLLELQTDLAKHNDKITSLQEEIKHCESQRQSEETRANSLKDVLIKLKNELTSVRNHETELINNEVSLNAQLELMKQQQEGYKVQLSESAAKLQYYEDSLNITKDTHQRSVRSLEAKIANLEEELKISQHEIESTKQEFENYKIRVHSVLKQQKHNNPTSTDKADQEVKDELQKSVEHLKLKVEELTDRLCAMKEENSAYQDEQERLLQRHSILVEELQAKDTAWNQKLKKLTAENSKFRAEQERLSCEHQQQTEKLKLTFKQQLQNLQIEYRSAVEELQKQLDAADEEIKRLQREQQKTGGPGISFSSQDEVPPFDIFSQERQAGEGSEFTEGSTTPIKHLSLATIPTVGFTPLEQLLQFSTESETPISVTSQHKSEEISVSLTSAYKKIDHLTEVLNESEASNLHLEEQVRVLKEEIRRLERNREREKHSENMEYLKNVVVKFLTLSGGNERERLIPILTTLLRLSPEEHSQLLVAAGDTSASLSSGTGWGNYLHRWSGFM